VHHSGDILQGRFAIAGSPRFLPTAKLFLALSHSATPLSCSKAHLSCSTAVAHYRKAQFSSLAAPQLLFGLFLGCFWSLFAHFGPLFWPAFSPLFLCFWPAWAPLSQLCLTSACFSLFGPLFFPLFLGLFGRLLALLLCLAPLLAPPLFFLFLARFGCFFRPALDRFLHIFGLFCPAVFKIWVETRNKLCKTGGEATSPAARVLDIGGTKVFHGAGREKQLRHALPLWTVSGLQKIYKQQYEKPCWKNLAALQLWENWNHGELLAVAYCADVAFCLPDGTTVA